MARESLRGWQFPNPLQELLLKAALGEAQEAGRSWALWRRQVGSAGLDAASQRLMPLVYRNLRSHGYADEVSGPLPAVYRKTWSQNRFRFHCLAHLIGRLGEAGIETIVLKGGALVPLAYHDFGARPMTDFDLLVRQERAIEAIHRLREWGWRSSLDSPESLIGMRHGDEFVDNDGQRLDLHWNLLQECCGRGANDAFWSASVAFEIDGARCRALCPADQLLHVIVHGACWSLVQPAGWVADATVLLRAAGDSLEWSRLLEQVQARRLTAPVRGALEYLRLRMGVDVPPEAIERLHREPVRVAERLEHRLKVGPHPLIGTLPVLWFNYLRLSEGGSPLERVVGFSRYLQVTFRCRSLASLVVRASKLAAARCAAYMRMHPGGVVPPPALHGSQGNRQAKRRLEASRFRPPRSSDNE